MSRRTQFGLGRIFAIGIGASSWSCPLRHGFVDTPSATPRCVGQQASDRRGRPRVREASCSELGPMCDRSRSRFRSQGSVAGDGCDVCFVDSASQPVARGTPATRGIARPRAARIWPACGAAPRAASASAAGSISPNLLQLVQHAGQSGSFRSWSVDATASACRPSWFTSSGGVSIRWRASRFAHGDRTADVRTARSWTRQQRAAEHRERQLSTRVDDMSCRTE